MSISIIIPVYNEADCILRCLAETRAAFHDIDHEIIVVNDGSTDQSDARIRGVLARGDRTKYISYAKNRGYSHAIRQGIQVAGKEYTSYLDADLQYPPTELARMYAFTLENQHKFVLGKPSVKYGKAHRRFLSFVYNLLVSSVLKLPVTDANSVKLIETRALKRLDLKRELGGIELEILVCFANQGLPLSEFPIRVQERVAGKSKCTLRLIVATIQDIMALRPLRKGSRCSWWPKPRTVSNGQSGGTRRTVKLGTSHAGPDG